MNERVKIGIGIVCLIGLLIGAVLLVLCTDTAFAYVLEAGWEFLTDSAMTREWEKAALAAGIFSFFFVIQWLTMRCRRKILRYIPLGLMSVLWVWTEYMIAAETGMGAIIATVFVGFPVVIGWLGTIFSCIVWHIRKYFRKTA